jgi:hypothetical protein
MLGMEDRSYPNLKKNKKKSDSEPNLVCWEWRIGAILISRRTRKRVTLNPT